MEIIRLDKTIPVGEAERVLAEELGRLVEFKYTMERQAEAASNQMDLLEAKYAKLQSRELWKRVTDTEDKEDEEQKGTGGRKPPNIPTLSFFSFSFCVPEIFYYSYTIVKAKVKRFMGVYSILYYLLQGGVVL